MNRWARQRDANEPAIVMALRNVGAEVWRMEDMDLLVAFRGQWNVLEVKIDHKQTGTTKNTAARQEEHRKRAARCGCEVPIVTTSEEALRVVGAIV